MVVFKRTHTCGELREQNVGQNVTLSGWVHRARDLGGLLFIDLRDRFGITQVVLDSAKNKELYELGQKLRAEFVISIKGEVFKRKDANPKLPTGQIEITANELHVLSKAEVPPFTVADDMTEANEELRLKYRYLDMRKGPILDNLVIRHKAMMATRQFMDSQGFVEVITPILSKSTPEGARDYLVPSRVNPGQFFALPQSPQMFKQILMIGGLDRYFQIATCFRDEDLRADRQPEFAQIDVEMSFATQDELFPIIENLVQSIFKHCKDVAVDAPFLRMSYADCMEHYGCDKPDLRFGMRLKRLDSQAQASSFTIFHDILANGGTVKGFTIKGGADISRKGIDEYTSFVGQLGVKGLAYIKLQDGTFSSSLAKFIAPEQQPEWQKALEMENGDLAFIIAGTTKKTNQALDHLRRRVAKDRKLIAANDYKFLWVTDFPLFTYNEEEGRLESEHHPFTSPHLDDIDLIEKEPLKARSSSYDLVLNGYEIASGSQRIHDSHLQDTIFRILGLNEEERKMRFGFFIEALQFGTPPHIGVALGFDRMIMILVETEGIRDVIAFPKTQKASCLMTGAPSEVATVQLKELKIATT
ncbi:MAG: aspartate--tRNA ligase [Verrucomicrobia bacterium]|nr:aspartate--tRNA ligase [Verrucomicrobiota bacterium]MBS0637357.1 aspartate--tRNA ligase [Verrucomicrobiota bacterium]